MNKINETEQLLTQLCERFTNIFEQIKEIRQSRLDLDDENQHLEKMIQEENQKFEEAAEQLEQTTEQLQNQCSNAEQGKNLATSKEDSHSNIQNFEKLSKQLESRRGTLEIAHIKLKEVTVQLNSDIQIRESQENQKKQLEQKLKEIKQSIQEHQSISQNLENNLLEINSKNQQMSSQIQNLILSIANHEDQLKESIDNKYQREGDFKQSKQEFRTYLHQSTHYQKQTKENEKIVLKLTEELKSKQSRLEILNKNKQKLDQKVQQIELWQREFENQQKINQELEFENQQLSQKLDLLVEQNDNQQTHNASTMSNKKLNKQKSSSNYNNFVSQNDQNQNQRKESELYKLGKQNIIQSDYLQNLDQALADKDNQIYKNKKQINEINESIKNSKQKTMSSKLEKDAFEKKYQILSENTANLKEQYNSLCKQYGIQQKKMNKV